jgi:hypothetical protein
VFLSSSKFPALLPPSKSRIGRPAATFSPTWGGGPRGGLLFPLHLLCPRRCGTTQVPGHSERASLELEDPPMRASHELESPQQELNLPQPSASAEAGGYSAKRPSRSRVYLALRYATTEHRPILALVLVLITATVITIASPSLHHRCYHHLLLLLQQPTRQPSHLLLRRAGGSPPRPGVHIY